MSVKLFAKNPTLCQYRQLFCFCVSCFDRNLEVECINKDHVLEWTLAHLRPRNSLEVQEMMYDSDEKIEASTEGERIFDNQVIMLQFLQLMNHFG
jgi:hypothetical protein